MEIKEVLFELDAMEVSDAIIEKAQRAFEEKVQHWTKSGLYRKQGGIIFEFKDGSVAWVSIWSGVYCLTERGETIIQTISTKVCAEYLYKLGLLHQMRDDVLPCK